MTEQVLSSEVNVEHAVLLDTDLQPWHERMEELMAAGARIIAFRGPGSVAGIEPAAAEAMRAELHKYITDITADGTRVAIIYDGDDDNRERPDIGSLFGTLADSLADNPEVTPISVQTSSWYEEHDGVSAASATGHRYETYAFDADLPDIEPSLKARRGLAHSALTQSDALVAYAGYEQVVVGAAGPIAALQLQDLARRSAYNARPVYVTILSSSINPAMDEELRYRAENDPDESRRVQAIERLARRERLPYGALFTSDGEFALDPTRYPNVVFNVTLIR